MTSSLDTAIRLIRQAVHQDSEKNYEEAARCYREGIVYFRLVLKTSASKRVKNAIQSKCRMYEDRLRRIEKHLLFKHKFVSKLFKDVVDSHVNDAIIDDSHNEKDDLKKGLELVERAKKLDSQNEFRTALAFYEAGKRQFLKAISGKRSGNEQDWLRIQCLLIHDRTEIIKEHLERNAPIAIRKENLNCLESGLCYNEQLEEEEEENEELLCMEEKTDDSRLQSAMAGSTHSLYPRCEIKRSSSVISGASDFGISGPFLKTNKPPLADLNQELRLSFASSLIDDSDDDNGIEDKLLEDDTDGILVLDNVEEDDERITPQMYNKSYCSSSSDSGISDPLSVDDGLAPRSSEVRSLGGDRKSPLSDVDSLDIVPSLPQAYPSDDGRENLIQKIPEINPPTYKRYEYIPPRAFAKRMDKEESRPTDGCFYFMSCLDAFGIL